MKATEQFFPVGQLYYAVQGGSNFSVCQWNPKVWLLKWKPLREYMYFPVVRFIMPYKAVLSL